MITEETQDITVAVGDTFTVSLAAQIGTGYTWQLQQDQESDQLVQLLEKAHNDADDQQDGGTGADQFTFEAVKKGETEMVFIYARPWEKAPEDVAGAKQKRFPVVIE